MKGWIVALVAVTVMGALSFGCTRHYEMRVEIPENGADGRGKTRVGKVGVVKFDYDACRRGAYFIVNKDGAVRILTEPSPDAASTITSSLGVSADTIGQLSNAEAKADYAKTVLALASRSQTLQVAREALFRMNELEANGELPSSQAKIELFKEILSTIRLVAATEFAEKVPEKDRANVVRGLIGKNTFEDLKPNPPEVPGKGNPPERP